MLLKFGIETEQQFSHLLDTLLPKGYSQWHSPLLAKALDGDVPVHQVWHTSQEVQCLLGKTVQLKPGCMSGSGYVDISASLRLCFNDLRSRVRYPPDRIDRPTVVDP